MDDVPYPGYDYNGSIMKPLGVVVPVNEKHGSSERKSMIIIIVLSCITIFVLFIGAAWLYLLKCRPFVQKPEHFPDDSILSSSKPSGIIFTAISALVLCYFIIIISILFYIEHMLDYKNFGILLILSKKFDF